MPTQPHFSLLATSFPGGPRPRTAALILAFLWLSLFVASLFSPPLLDDADATHAQAATWIARTGHLVTLHVDGIRYLEKAPLPYWLAALSFRLFGFNTFAAHLPQALTVALVALLGHRWANQAFGARTAFYTAISILTALGVFLFTRILIPEALLSLLLAAALFAFLRALNPNAPRTAAPKSAPLATIAREVHGLVEVKEHPSIAWYAGPRFYPAVMWSTLALAVLTKGLVALVFFLLITGLYLTLTATWPDARRLLPLPGVLLFLAIAAPWHILAALHNPATSTHPGFLWFYFWNEHVLRFLGRRTPCDYDKLPGYAYWLQHLLWLFPWSLFLPLGLAAVSQRYKHQTEVLSRKTPLSRRAFYVIFSIVFLVTRIVAGPQDITEFTIIAVALFLATLLLWRRKTTGLPPSPFHRIDLQQRSILLLSLFALTVLFFFSLSTNQEYYTFPAYLPLLLLTAATITRAEQTYTSSPASRRWITFAHAAFIALGSLAALALAICLWTSRHLPFQPDIGLALAHRNVASYNLSTSHLFDLTAPAFAALRLPATLAALALLLGPLLAALLRQQRRHIAATTAFAFTAAAFLLAAHLALTRFTPMLSSRAFADHILTLESTHRIAPDTQILLLGDQSFGSSIPFYLGRDLPLVEGRSSSMLFGSQFPDAAPMFLTLPDLARTWGHGPRKILFAPPEALPLLNPSPLTPTPILLFTQSNKLLLTDRPLDP